MNRSTWGTQLGFYLAAIGTAFGLGNLWRFPFVVSQNGGGAFVLLYFGLVIVLGSPFLMGELILGKATRASLWPAVKKLKTKSRFLSGVGIFSTVLCLVMLAYYGVISGWVLHYMVQFLSALVHGNGFDMPRSLSTLLENGWLQVLLTSVHVALVALITINGIEQGIERWIVFIQPAFLILLGVLAIKALSLDSAYESLRFLFYPDFSKLTSSSLSEAIGHVFFSLSVGYGVMVTYGSYLNERTFIPVAGLMVAIVDAAVSLLAAVLVFPLGGVSEPMTSGPLLLFQAVPKLFAQMPGGLWFGVFFFLCLYLSALGASIGLLETVITNLRHRLRWPRKRLAVAASLFTVALSVAPALSSSMLASVRLGERGVLQILDRVLVNWLLPILALIISQVAVRLLDEEVKRSEFTSSPHFMPQKLYAHWSFAMRWLSPLLILTGFALQLL